MDSQTRILVIDDDPVFVEATKIVLESKNYLVITAPDGAKGLQKAEDEKPDLILLDIIMPTHDGFHVCEQLKGNPQLADIPVIMLTSFAKQKGETNIPVSAGFQLEAEGYLDKPVDPEELLEYVGKMIGK